MPFLLIFQVAVEPFALLASSIATPKTWARVASSTACSLASAPASLSSCLETVPGNATALRLELRANPTKLFLTHIFPFSAFYFIAVSFWVSLKHIRYTMNNHKMSKNEESFVGLTPPAHL